jgi:hypothetical protein
MSKEEKLNRLLLELQQTVSKVTVSDLLPIPCPAKPGKHPNMIFHCSSCGEKRNESFFWHNPKCYRRLPRPHLPVSSAIIIKDGVVILPAEYDLGRREVLEILIKSKRLQDVDTLLTTGFIDEGSCAVAVRTMSLALATKLVQAGIIYPGSRSWEILQNVHVCAPWAAFQLHASMAVATPYCGRLKHLEKEDKRLYLDSAEQLATLFKQERDSVLLSCIAVRGVFSMVVAYLF